MFIPTSAEVFITISSAWKLKFFWRLLFWALYVCAFFRDCFCGLGLDWLSIVLRLRQHNIGYTADGFYRSDDRTNSVKALKEGG